MCHHHSGWKTSWGRKTNATFRLTWLHRKTFSQSKTAKQRGLGYEYAALYFLTLIAMLISMTTTDSCVTGVFVLPWSRFSYHLCAVYTTFSLEPCGDPPTFHVRIKLSILWSPVEMMLPFQITDSVLFGKFMSS